MADTDATIVIGIELDDGTIRKATLNAEELAKSMGQAIRDNVSTGVDKSFTGIITQLNFAANIAKQAFGAVSGILGTAISEADAADQALTKFNLTLANAGKFTQAASDEFAAFAAQLQAVGTVSDDAILGAADSLVSIGKLSGPALKSATQASVDLAAGLGVDLNTAFDLVAKASAGNTAALGRYGIKVSEEIPKSERFANVLGQINQKFGGLDVGKANTFGGAFTQLRNSFGDLLENIGNLIVKSPAVIGLFKGIAGVFQSLSERVAQFTKGGDVFRPIITGALEFARVITQNVLPVFELLFNFSKFVFNSILTGITALGAAFSGVTNVIVQGLNTVGIVGDETAGKFQANYTANAEALSALATQTSESFSQITTDFSITAQADQYVADLQRTVDATTQIGPQLATNLKPAQDGVVNSFALTAKKLAEIYNNGVVNLISQGVQTIVTNLAKGKNAFEGLLKTIGSIFGDMLIQIGTTVLLAGVGMEAIRASIVGLTGGPAIFAGIALIAAGALLKALSGGGGESASTTVPAGPGGVPSNPDVVGSVDQPEQDRNRKSEVKIEVQGNILDRKETGLEIASVLQEYFDTQDGILARG
jgi:hypothetical protein